MFSSGTAQLKTKKTYVNVLVLKCGFIGWRKMLMNYLTTLLVHGVLERFKVAILYTSILP